MSDGDLWEKSLDGANYEKISEFAANVPKVLNDASMGGGDGSGRDTGLILTKKQIIDLRKYEAAGLALPYKLADVVNYLNFGVGEDGGAGLRVDEFLETFLLTRNHAKRWSPLRERIMLTGAELNLFGASMEIYGNSVEELYEDVKAGKILDKYNVQTLAELKKVQLDLGDKFPGLELEPNTVLELGYYLGKIFDKVNRNLRSVEDIKKDLDFFDGDLRLKVLPSIKLRVELIKRNPYSSEIKALDDAIARRADQITEKNAQYKALVEKSLAAAAGLNIFGLGMAIYYGVEAEKIRAERNKLNQEQDRDIELIRNKNQTLGSLRRVEHDLQSLDFIAVEAEVATRNLVFVWNTIYRYIKESQSVVASINDALSLRQFMTAFREVVSPWVKIQHDADALIGVFKDADEEYDREAVNSSEKVLSMLSISNYPQLNMKLLQKTNDAMRSTGVVAEALFIKFSYLPGVFDQFQRLVKDTDACTVTLRENSISSKVELDARIRRLLNLQQELNKSAIDSKEHAEIEGDIADELDKPVSSTRNAAGFISNRFANISGEFNRGETLGYLTGLKSDQSSLSETKERLNVRLAERQKEKEVILKAINLIEKTAIEDLGKDVNLTIDKLQGLGMAPPEVQVVKFAIEQIKKSIGDIAKGVTFTLMIKEYDALQSQINDLYNKLAEGDRKNTVLAGKIEFIEAIHTLDDQRVEYASEYKGADTAFRKFIEFLEGNLQGGVGERCARFVSEARSFSAFLSVSERP